MHRSAAFLWHRSTQIGVSLPRHRSLSLQLKRRRDARSYGTPPPPSPALACPVATKQLPFLPVIAAPSDGKRLESFSQLPPTAFVSAFVCLFVLVNVPVGLSRLGPPTARPTA